MSTIRKPKVGDQVLYFPSDGDRECRHNYLEHGEYLPAVVTRAFNNGKIMANLAVSCDGAKGGEALTAWRTSILHKSQIDYPVYDTAIDVTPPEKRIVLSPHWIYPEELEAHLEMLKQPYYEKPLRNEDVE